MSATTDVRAWMDSMIEDLRTVPHLRLVGSPEFYAAAFAGEPIDWPSDRKPSMRTMRQDHDAVIKASRRLDDALREADVFIACQLHDTEAARAFYDYCGNAAKGE